MATRTLSEQARKAMFKIINIEKQCYGLPPQTSWLLFDKLIKPVLLYGSEIWGSQSNYYIEKMQLNYCQLLLCVKSSANTSAVLGECGRYLLEIRNRNLHKTLANFRISCHNLAVEQGRHKNIPLNERICLICQKNGSI